MPTRAASFMIQIEFAPVARSWKNRSGFPSPLKSAVPCSPQVPSGFFGNAQVPLRCAPDWNQISFSPVVSLCQTMS